MSTIETWRISFPSEKGEGWAIIFMDSTGCFAALSDWGNVAYRWPNKGWGDDDFRKFVLGVDDDYLIGKFGQGQPKPYDPDATLKAVEKRIDEGLTEGSLSADDAEKEHERIVDNSRLGDRSEFESWCRDTELEDSHELYRTMDPRDAYLFVKRVMPRLRERLKQDLKL